MKGSEAKPAFNLIHPDSIETIDPGETENLVWVWVPPN